MDIVLFILMLLILLAEILFFQGNTLALIFAVVFCVLYLVLRIFLGKKLQGVKGVIARWVVLALIGVCIFQLGIKGTGGGFILYAQDMDTICGYLHQEEYDKAAEKLEELKADYGETDSVHMLSAIHHLSVGQRDEAYQEYQRISDQDSMVAVVIAEQIYQLDDSGRSTDELYDLYCRAADRYPEWEYIQLCAGVMKIDFKQYSSALYYLYNAYAVNPENPQTLYFLGEASYKTGKREDALDFFNASVENGADDKIRSLIKGYLDEMDYWNEGSAAE